MIMEENCILYASQYIINSYRPANMYVVYDSSGKYLRSFKTYKDAYSFIISMQRYDWVITQSK